MESKRTPNRIGGKIIKNWPINSLFYTLHWSKRRRRNTTENHNYKGGMLLSFRCSSWVQWCSDCDCDSEYCDCSLPYGRNTLMKSTQKGRNSSLQQLERIGGTRMKKDGGNGLMTKCTRRRMYLRFLWNILHACASFIWIGNWFESFWMFDWKVLETVWGLFSLDFWVL